MRRVLRVLACSLVVVAAGGCDDGGSPTVGGAGGGSGPTTTTPTTSTTTTTTSVTVPPTVPATASFPPQRAGLEHGGETFAVVLAASATFEDPVLQAAVDAAAAAGYATGPTDCDSGAPEALGFDDSGPDSIYTVSLYFETEGDARSAAAGFAERGVPAVVATVRTYCLD